MLNQIHSQITKNSTRLLLLFLGLGSCFRLIFGNHYGIGFDQVQIFTQAQKILDGDMTLIGPRTGPAHMFTGPLIYYLFAPLTALLGDTAAMILLPTFLAIATGIMLFMLARNAISASFALLVFVIWAFSPFLVELDRILWNPNLLLIASGLIFFSLIQAYRKTLSKKIFFQLMVGSFLAYQAHFSGLILVAIGIALAITYRIKHSSILALIFGLATSLLPTLLFDLRNEFLNARGLVRFALEREPSTVFSIPKEMIKNGYILAETAGKLLFAGNETSFLVTLGLILFCWSLWQARGDLITRFSLIWIFCIVSIYALYQKEKPEYYFLISVPAVLTLWSKSLQRFPRRAAVPLLLFFCVSATARNIHQAMIPAQMSAKYVQAIQNFFETQSVQSIEFDFPITTEPGLAYVLSNIPRSANGSVFRITYPSQLSFSGVQTFGAIGVWKDPRDPQKNSILTQGYIIETPPSLRVLKDLYPQSELEPLDLFTLIENDKYIGMLAIASNSQQRIPWVRKCEQLRNEGEASWHSLSSTSHLFALPHHCALLTENEEGIINKQNITLY